MFETNDIKIRDFCERKIGLPVVSMNTIGHDITLTFLGGVVMTVEIPTGRVVCANKTYIARLFDGVCEPFDA